MKLTFVPREDILEIAAIFVCIFIMYLGLNGDPLILLTLIIFAGLPLYFYIKKCKARWCSQCNDIMKYTSEKAIGTNYSVIYKCSKCGKVNNAGIFEGY